MNWVWNATVYLIEVALIAFFVGFLLFGIWALFWVVVLDADERRWPKWLP